MVALGGVPTSSLDRLYQAIAAASAVSTDLEGAVEMPPLPASRTVDAAGDSSMYAASHWSATMPHGFAAASRRAASSYDADVLEYFRALAVAEADYAAALQALTERLTREQPDAAEHAAAGGGGGGWFGGGARQLARSLQYSSAQEGWTSVQQAARAQARAHRAFSEEVSTSVVGPLKAAVKQAQARRAETLAPAARALEQVRESRRGARDECSQYGRLLHRFRREARRDPSRATAEGTEAALLGEAARACAESVGEANALTRRFEAEIEPLALDTLQEHEERRLESIDAAFTSFASAAATGGVMPAAAAEALHEATAKFDVSADVCGFAASYATACTRGGEQLVAPSFCEELAAATEEGRAEAGGFWGALWRPLKALAATVLGDDGRDEPVIDDSPFGPGDGSLSRNAMAKLLCVSVEDVPDGLRGGASGGVAAAAAAPSASAWGATGLGLGLGLGLDSPVSLGLPPTPPSAMSPTCRAEAVLYPAARRSSSGRCGPLLHLPFISPASPVHLP